MNISNQMRRFCVFAWVLSILEIVFIFVWDSTGMMRDTTGAVFAMYLLLAIVVVTILIAHALERTKNMIQTESVCHDILQGIFSTLSGDENRTKEYPVFINVAKILVKESKVPSDFWDTIPLPVLCRFCEFCLAEAASVALILCDRDGYTQDRADYLNGIKLLINKLEQCIAEANMEFNKASPECTLIQDGDPHWD